MRTANDYIAFVKISSGSGCLHDRVIPECEYPRQTESYQVVHLYNTLKLRTSKVKAGFMRSG